MRHGYLLYVYWLAAGYSGVAAAGPPPTRVDNVKEVLHGVTIADPYRWLEDQNSPETRAWIDAQNRYTRSLLDPLPGRDRIRRRVAELLKVDSTSVPVERAGRYFFSRRLANQDQPVLYLRRGSGAKDEPLVDPNPLSADHTTSVSLLEVSRDGKLMVYGLRKGGEDEVVLRIFDVESKRDLPDEFPRARYYGVSFTLGRGGFYYTRYGAEGTRVYYHALGSKTADPEIFGRGYTRDKFVIAEVSEDGRTLVIQVYHGSAADVTEIYSKDLASNGPVRAVVNDVAARFSGHAAGGTLFVATNWQAPTGRVFAVDLANPSRQHWREIIRASDTAVLDDCAPVGGKLLVNYLENVHSVLKVFTPEGAPVREIPLPALGTAGDLSGRWAGKEVFFQFSSFHIPPTVFRYDLAGGREQVWSRTAVPVDSSAFEVRQVWYGSRDGTRVPMFLVHRKGLKPDGNRPVLLTGYGGFNLSRTAEFAPRAVFWAEQGGVFALPNLRGGGEFGEKWHRAGMLGNKQNVFDDFIGAAEWLIKSGYTNPSRLAITGRSNGGLLVGAALTQRPELFAAVVCGYPLLDMVRYDKFLIARLWAPEYGSAEDPKQFKYIYAYSPYHHVRKGVQYPAVFLQTGDSDTRVAPLHARKMAALLQASTGSDRPVLLHYDTKAGHTSGLPISKQVEDATDELSFLLWHVGTSR